MTPQAQRIQHHIRWLQHIGVMLDHAHWAVAACCASTTTVGDGVVDKCKEGRWKLLGVQICIQTTCRPEVGRRAAVCVSPLSSSAYCTANPGRLLVRWTRTGKAQGDRCVTTTNRWPKCRCVPELGGGVWLGGSGTTAARIGQILRHAVQTAICSPPASCLRLTDMPASNRFVNSTF